MSPVRRPSQRSDRGFGIGDRLQSDARPSRIVDTQSVHPLRHGIVQRHHEKVRPLATDLQVQRGRAYRHFGKTLRVRDDRGVL